jgi:hypothetical protein
MTANAPKTTKAARAAAPHPISISHVTMHPRLRPSIARLPRVPRPTAHPAATGGVLSQSSSCFGWRHRGKEIARRTCDASETLCAPTCPVQMETTGSNRLTSTLEHSPSFAGKCPMSRHDAWSSLVVGTGVDPVTFRFSGRPRSAVLARRGCRVYWGSSAEASLPDMSLPVSPMSK